MNTDGTVEHWWAVPLLVVFAAIAVGGFYWRFVVQWWNGIRGRNWPAVSANIDIVSVVEQRQQTGKGDIVTYLATLTYFYRNPELQSGDYSRLFEGTERGDAESWAASYKGSTVIIHVDPRDPTVSILRKEDL